MAGRPGGQHICSLCGYRHCARGKPEEMQGHWRSFLERERGFTTNRVRSSGVFPLGRDAFHDRRSASFASRACSDASCGCYLALAVLCWLVTCRSCSSDHGTPRNGFRTPAAVSEGHEPPAASSAPFPRALLSPDFGHTGLCWAEDRATMRTAEPFEGTALCPGRRTWARPRAGQGGCSSCCASAVPFFCPAQPLSRFSSPCTPFLVEPEREGALPLARRRDRIEGRPSQWQSWPAQRFGSQEYGALITSGSGARSQNSSSRSLPRCVH